MEDAEVLNHTYQNMTTINQHLIRDHSPPLSYILFATLKSTYMKPFFLTVLNCLLFLASNAQLEKGTWLVGGTASLFSTKNTFTSVTTTTNTDALRLTISPSIGYFLADKFTVGLRPGFTKIKSETAPNGGNTNENRLDIGPFARYYFLEKTKQFNFLLDASYQYGFYWFTPTTGNRHTFSASAGAEVFFNSTVGLELLIGYYKQNERIDYTIGSTTSISRGLQMMIGFQFHLEK